MCGTYHTLQDKLITFHCSNSLSSKFQAIRDNDKVWGVITTGCNQDGHMSTPITAPSGVQQTKLLQSVYQKFNINPADIQYIEAHGENF